MAAAADLERQYYDRLFSAVDKDGTGVLDGAHALPLLSSSGLPQQTLGEIWDFADPSNNGFLTPESFYKVARIIGWMQQGGHTSVDSSLADKPGPYPTFKGFPPPPPQSASPLASTASGHSTSAMPPLTLADRSKFTRLFSQSGPQNGLLAGDKARDMFLKSGLGYEKLSQIWNLADTHERGALDLADFVIGMYLIQSCMAYPALVLPSTLPPGIYGQASKGRHPPPRATSPAAGAASPVQRQFTGTLQQQMTGQSALSRSATATPSRQSSFMPPAAPTVPPAAVVAAWDVTPSAKAQSDQFFDQLDTEKRGVVEGNVAVQFMLLSNLDEELLATIWDLASVREEGNLDRDEFAVAMYLINSKLSGGELPATLPPSLIPPNLRSIGKGAKAVAPPQPAANKDLFDLFNDDEPLSTPTASPGAAPVVQRSAPTFLPQPPSRRDVHRGPAPAPPAAHQRSVGFANSFTPQVNVATQPAGDLLGDDSAEAQPSSVPDHSADIGNKRNQLANTTRTVSDLEKAHADLNSQSASNTSQLAELEKDLAAAREKHETEAKAVSDLRIRVGEQTAKLKQLQADVISAESDLTALKMEKDELEQSLLRDKEEVRGLQSKMKEVDDEKAGLKLLLEKLKKEARQQKGMVSIAKKQVSTAESSRDAVQAEIRAVEKEAEDVQSAEALGSAPSNKDRTRTPQTLSPEATGASQRSTNPFDRFRTGSAGHRPSGPFSDTASMGLIGAGLAAGAVGAGSAFAMHTAGESEAAPAPQSAGEDPFGISTIRESEPGPNALGDGFESSFTGFDEFPGSGASVHKTTDFDTAFADFDGGAENTDVQHTDPAEPQGPVSESQAGTAQDEQHASQRDSLPSGSKTQELTSEQGPTDSFEVVGAPHGTAESESTVPETDNQFSVGVPSSNLQVLPDALPNSEHSPSAQVAPASTSEAPTPVPVDDSTNIAIAEKDVHPVTGDDAGKVFDDGNRALAVAGTVDDADVGTAHHSASGVHDVPDVNAGAGAGSHTEPASVPDATAGVGTAPVTDSGIGHEDAALNPVPHPITAAEQIERDEESSDDDEGPEDLDGPLRRYASPSAMVPTPPQAVDTTTTAHDSAPATPHGDEHHPKTRRSAPPPPVPRTGVSFPIGAVSPPRTPSGSQFSLRDAMSPPNGPTSPAVVNVTPPPSQPVTEDAIDPFNQPASLHVTNPTVEPVEATTSDPSGSGAATATGAVASDVGAHHIPKMAEFDDEDEFDFPDLPPPSKSAVPSASGAKPSTAFDDEFTNFDDDFDKPSSQFHSGSDNSNSLLQSYEVVPPTGKDGQTDQDEWGFSSHAKAPAANTTNDAFSFNDAFGAAQRESAAKPTNAAFSFDDAFGDGFSNQPVGGASAANNTQQFDDIFGTDSSFPPSGSAAPNLSFDDAFGSDFGNVPPPTSENQTTKPPSSAAPTLPQRPAAARVESQNESAQPDDVEDVKKLCAMGFPRSLVVEALGANGYSFQKALNVLLAVKE